MSTILVTGASGFVGSALSATLGADHEVVGLSRSPVDHPDVRYVAGDFGSFEALRQLDKWDFDSVIHLGAVLGGAPERDCMLVNGEGSRCLMRYLIDPFATRFSSHNCFVKWPGEGIVDLGAVAEPGSE